MVYKERVDHIYPKKRKLHPEKKESKDQNRSQKNVEVEANPVKVMFLCLMQIFLKVKRNLKFLTKKMLIRINLSRGRKILN